MLSSAGMASKTLQKIAMIQTPEVAMGVVLPANLSRGGTVHQLFLLFANRNAGMGSRLGMRHVMMGI